MNPWVLLLHVFEVMGMRKLYRILTTPTAEQAKRRREFEEDQPFLKDFSPWTHNPDEPQNRDGDDR